MRRAVRQLADDLAKIAQSCAVVPLLTFALLLANAMALKAYQKSSSYSKNRLHSHVLIICDVHSGAVLSVRTAGTSRGRRTEAQEVEKTVSLRRLFELALLRPECSSVLYDIGVNKPPTTLWRG